MTKAHHKTGSGSQKPEVTNTKSSTTNKQATSASTSGSTNQSSSSKTTPTPSISIETEKSKGKQTSKNRKPAIGGTAVQGAKSTQPKEITASSSPAQQEAESYNREMRRRMQHMGTGPYGSNPTDVVRNRRQKRVDKRKQQQEDVKKTVATQGPSTNIKLGRKNTYFVLGTLFLIVLAIVVAIIIRHPF